jgi:tetratricopeptide (TPR) repeat protein
MGTADEEDELRKSLSSLTQKHFTEKPEARVIPFAGNRKKWWLYATAAAASIALLFIFKPWQDKVLTNQEIYSQNAVPEDLPAIVRGNNEDTVLLRAVDLYNKKDYVTALPVLENIILQKPGEAQLQLALGVCYLQTGNYNAAINKFDSLVTGQSTYKYDALIWKALLYLKQDRKEDCITLLKQIPPEAGNYKKAGEMMKELSR